MSDFCMFVLPIFVMRRSFNSARILIRPEVWIAKIKIIIPPIISIVLLCVSRNCPRDPTTAPNMKNTTVNPSVNRIAWRIGLRFWLLMYAK